MDLWMDVRLAFRRLLRTPTITIAAVAALAAGLGATSAIFTLVHAMFVEGLPYREPDRLISLGGTMDRNGGTEDWPMGYLDLLELRSQQVVAGPAAVTGPRSFNLVSGDVSVHVTGELVSHDYFDIIGVGTAAGRTFTAEEDDAGAPARVAVISHDLWVTHFGAERDVPGRTLRLNEMEYEIIGVAQRGFAGLTDDASVWLPIAMAGPIYNPGYTTVRQFRWLGGVARVRDGFTTDQAQQALSAVAGRLREAYPVDNEGFGVSVTPMSETYFGSMRQPLMIVLCAALFVLLIACTNVANLLLVRGLDRRQEVAVRGALGAGRGRIVRQFMIDTIVLVMVGLGAGLVTAEFALRALVRSGGLQLASFIDLGVDPVVIGVASALALLCALVFGIVPALLSTRVAAASVIRENSNTITFSRGRNGFQSLMLAAEVALALALLTGATLMTRGFSQFSDVELGMEPAGVMTGRIDLTGEQYRDNERFWSTVRGAIDGARAIPGVTQVSAEGPGLPTSGFYAMHFRRIETPDETVMTLRHHVTPGYFDALDITLSRGRDFTDGDRGTGGTVPIILSEELAQALYPGEDPLGRTLLTAGNDTLRFQVVGVAAPARHNGISSTEATAPAAYVPLYILPPRIPPVVTLIVKHDRADDEMAAALDDAVKTAAPNLPMFDAQSLEQRLGAQTATARLMTRLVGTFSIVALLLCAIGIYGIVSYSVKSRTREIGIRMALGASRASVLRDALRRIFIPVGIGLAAGAVAALVLARFAESLLFGLDASDPFTMLLAAAVISGVAAASTIVPARRALRTDPREALRP